MKSRFATALVIASLMFIGLAGTLFAKVLSYEISSEGLASVQRVVAGTSADLVLLNSGMEKNFCTGALCVVERDGESVAELIIAEANAENSVALITQLNTKQTILAGDSVKLKTITF